MMKLFYAPNTCSLGISVILEEIGADYDAVAINFREKEQFSPEYRAVNPKGKVPAIVRDDGSVLTEFQTIAFWLAETNPQAGLLATDPETRIRTMELLDFMVGSVHMRGFTFVLVPMKFTPDAEGQKQLQKHGREQIEIGFARLSEYLKDSDWLMGEFSIADAALLYMTQWASEKDVPMPQEIAAFHNRMLERPTVLRMLEKEGRQPRQI